MEGHRHHLRIVGLFVIGLFFISLVSWVSYGIWQTKQAATKLIELDMPSAAQHAQKALPVTNSLNLLSFRQIPDIQFWHSSLELIIQSPQIATTFQTNLFSDTINTASSRNPTPSLHTYFQQLPQLKNWLEQSWLLSRLYPSQTQALITVFDRLITIDQTLLIGDQTVLILFQNSQELRATGGFIGSYALVKMRDGQVIQMDVQDIYVPDGQFTGFVTPPPGVQEYLSGGNGLRLPDANWWPDFPSSAQQILAYFALGKESNIDLVIAVNLEAAESSLGVLGELFLPDYQTTITPQNLSDQIRSQRGEFFPGSIAKQHLLSSLFTQVKFRLKDLTANQQQQLITILLNAARLKQIQVFALDERLQKVLAEYELTGQMTSKSNTTSPLSPFFYLFLVESNVGINKANQGVSRQVWLTINRYETQITIDFHNTNQLSKQINTPTDKSPHYVNYMRVFLQPEVEINQLYIDNQLQTIWDEELITTSTGEHFKQIGFLVTVPAQSDQVVKLNLRHPDLGTRPPLVIQKQAGLAPTSYIIDRQGKTQELLLEQDTVVP